MKYTLPLICALAFLIGWLAADLVRAYRMTGQMQATGEEWERIEKGYVEETQVTEGTCYFNQEIYIDGKVGSHWLCE
jgi:hypothetical protein